MTGRENSAPAVSVTGLSYTYNGKDYAVNDVSFEVERGEIFGLLGRNGAGKTTIIKILTTLIQPSQGKATVLGYDTRKDGSEVRRRIGLVQQETSFEFSTVRENFDLYGYLWGVSKPVRLERRERLSKFFELNLLLKTDAVDLSTGQKRRVQVAREFIHDMDLLFLDEPTVGLDPIMRRRVLDMLKDKARHENLTIVFTTHNLEEADYLCDRVAIMDQGKFGVVDTIENLKQKYGGKKTVEVQLAKSNGVDPSYDSIFSGLVDMHPDLEIAQQPRDGNPAVFLTTTPEDLIGSIIQIALEQKTKIEWLSIRKSTLEDVFLQMVSSAEGPQENGRVMSS